MQWIINFINITIIVIYIVIIVIITILIIRELCSIKKKKIRNLKLLLKWTIIIEQLMLLEK